MAKRKRPMEKKVYASPSIVYEKKIETLALVCDSARTGWAPNCRKEAPCTKLRT